MKGLLFISLLICTLFSCTKDDGFDIEQYPQKWLLVKMTGQVPKSGTTGTNMAWQEFYLLNSNGTFKKTREQNGKLTEVSGTYAFQDLSDGKYLVLTYSAENNIIGSCIPTELKEVLRLKSNSSLYSTWFACDGPGLEYNRAE